MTEPHQNEHSVPLVRALVEIIYRVRCEQCGLVGSRSEEADALRLRDDHLRESHGVRRGSAPTP